MQPFDDLARKLRDARSTGQEATVTEGDLPATLPDAYSLALSAVDSVAAWKLGGVNPWSRKAFSNTELFFGPLAREEVFLEASEVPISTLNQPLAEVEIALRMGKWPPDNRSPLFTQMSICVEIPATVLPMPAKATLLGQVSDRAGAGALWVGSPQPFDARMLMSEVKVELSHDDGPVQEGSSSNILASPLGAAFEFMALALKYGVELQEGQWIATGGLRPANPVKPHSEMTIRHPWGVSSLQFV